MPTTSSGPDVNDLNPDFHGKLSALMDAVRKAGGNPVVDSGYRSAAQQQYLYEHPEARAPGAPAAKPGQSLHEKGLAADVSGDAKTTQLLHSMAPQFGLSFPLSNDPVHVQLSTAAKMAGAGGSAQVGADAQSSTPQAVPLADRLNLFASMFSSGGLKVETSQNTDTSVAPDTSQSADTTKAVVTTPGAPVPAAAGAATNVPSVASAPASQFQALFDAAGKKYGVSPALLSAMARQESDYNPGATSGAGAIGLMQIMPGTAHGLGVDPHDPAQAVDGAARMMSGFMKQYGGDVNKALAAYNAGPGAVQRYGGVPPYEETQKYVSNVKGYMNGGND